jgi:hypothetical protein
MLRFSTILQSLRNSTLLQMQEVYIRAKNEKLHKSQRMWYINSLKNEVDEAI